MAVFAFVVHPDERDVRVAIKKRNILHSALTWTSAALLLIQAGITIASPVCMGPGAGSCVEKSFYPGITVKF